MIRKGLMHFIAALLIALPLLGVLADDAGAASSRVAIVKEYEGDVTVKKSGGSKTFKAYTKMSLNEGDILTVGADSSAVLQFANGTSEDDLMTVDAGTTLTFSKLSDKKGTRTKISMLKGSAWVDVKSIAGGDDEFELETPTAIMGVRGTHLGVAVDPVSGTTRVVVLAGIVQTRLPNPSPTQLIYPGYMGTLLPGMQREELPDAITLLDVQQFISQASPKIIQAILENGVQITQENIEYLNQFENEGYPESLTGTQEDLERFARNLQNVFGAVISEALRQGTINRQQAEDTVKKVKDQTGQEIDLENTKLILDEDDQDKIDRMMELMEEAARQALARKKQEQDRLDALPGNMLQTLQQRLANQQTQNQQALDQMKAASEAKYLATLTPEQRAAYLAERNGRTTTSPVIVPPSANANLSGLALSAGTLAPAFAKDHTDYSAVVGNAVSSLTVTPTAEDAGAAVKVNGQTLASGSQTVELKYGENAIDVEVTAPDGSTKKTYALNVTRELLNSVSFSFGSGSSLNIDFTSPNPVQQFDVPEDEEHLTLSVPSDGPALAVAANGNEIMPEPVMMAALTVLPGQIAWKYRIPLSPGSNEIKLTATIDGVSKTYTLYAIRALPNGETPSDDATLKSLAIEGQQLAPAFAPETTGYAAIVPAGTESLSIGYEANDGGASAKLLLNGSEEGVNGHSVSLAAGTRNTVSVVVTAENGLAQKTYEIVVNRAPTAQAVETSTTAGEWVLVELLGDDADKDELSYEIAGPANGTLEPYEGRKYKYTPNAGFSGTDSFTYTVSDGLAESEAAAGTVVVEDVSPVPSADANLSGLSLSLGEQSPVFHADVTDYAANVPAGTESLTLQFETSHHGATAKLLLNGSEEGVDGHSVALAAGTRNTVSVVVAAENGVAEKTYEIVVNRAPTAQAVEASTTAGEWALVELLGDDADGDELDYEIAGPANGTLEPYEGRTYKYTPNAGFSGTDSFTYTVDDGSAPPVSAAGTIAVSSEPPSTDASLATLGLSAGELDPAFDPGTTNYIVTVPAVTSTLTGDFAANDPGASAQLLLNGTVNGVSGTTVILNAGVNVIEITVTAADGETTRTYTVTVNREPPPNPVGVTGWVTKANGQETAWTLTDETVYPGEPGYPESLYQDYALYYETAPGTFEVGFEFEENVVDPVLYMFDQAIDLETTPGPIPVPTWHEGPNDARVEYGIVDEGENIVKYVTLYLTVYVGNDFGLSHLEVRLASELRVDLYPSGNGTYTGTVPDTSYPLMVRASAAMGSVKLKVNGAEAEGMDGSFDGIELNEGWNVLEIEVYNPVTGELKNAYAVTILAGDPGLYGLRLDGVKGSDGTKVFAFERLHDILPYWYGMASYEATYVDIEPLAPQGTSIEDVLVVDAETESYSSAPLQNGKYRIPFTEESAFAVVLLKTGDRVLAHAVAIEREAGPLQGLVSWSTEIDGEEAFWTLEDAYPGETFEERYYGMKIESIPDVFTMTFEFDENVANAEIVVSDQTISIASGIPVDLSQWIREGEATQFDVNYDIADGSGGVLKSVYLGLTVYAGYPELSEFSVYLDDDQMTPVDVNPTGANTFSAVVANPEERLLIGAYPTSGDLGVYVNGIQIYPDGPYFADLAEGWNTIEFKLYHPVDGTLANTYELQVWAGASQPEGLGLAAIDGADETGSPIQFVRSEAGALDWNAFVQGAAYADIAPVAEGEGTIAGVLYYDENGDLVQAEPAAGSGAYRVPLVSDFTTAFAAVQANGRLLSHEITLQRAPFLPEVGLMLRYGDEGSFTGTYPYRFGNTYWNNWNEGTETVRMVVNSGGQENYSYTIDGTPMDAFNFAGLVEGDNVYEFRIADGTGREAVYYLHLWRDGTWKENVTIPGLSIKYGVDQAAEASLSTTNEWGQVWMAYPQAGITDAEVSFQLASGSTAELYDGTGNTVIWQGMPDPQTLQVSIPISFNAAESAEGNQLLYHLVLTDSAGNQYMYPITLAFIGGTTS
ncbi:cadherin-like beta sandwich domain-containing protein [Cohnella massiliensis]|uniref:cadherin-like beta sandwich domain-containing protein n=1 Tax=Cohnella massiliensis TaxID=1816691 RepID=UPI0009BA6163|nr:cadherin-like beta sandwich domain-containing protein [Cohnella massiliensis]